MESTRPNNTYARQRAHVPTHLTESWFMITENNESREYRSSDKSKKVRRSSETKSTTGTKASAGKIFIEKNMSPQMLVATSSSEGKNGANLRI